MNNKPVSGRSSETKSHPIDMIIIKARVYDNLLHCQDYHARHEELKDEYTKQRRVDD
jgi:hypothetical protein